ncbi:MAG: hypothetical protein ACKPER_28905, partial [Dolichospermum sp.]
RSLLGMMECDSEALRRNRCLGDVGVRSLFGMWRGAIAVWGCGRAIAFLFLFAKLAIMTIAIKLYVPHRSTSTITRSDRKP